jgi:hypothetical protein
MGNHPGRPLSGAARSVRVRTFVVPATGKLASRSVGFGAPEPSFSSSCQLVWAPRWKPMPMHMTKAESVKVVPRSFCQASSGEKAQALQDPWWLSP